MNFKHIFLSSVFAASVFAVSAVPAKPGLITMVQSDGSEIEVRLVGDEFSHYYLSEDGYLLTLQGHDFYYADVDASGSVVTSGIKATPAALRPQAARSFLSRVDMGTVLEAMDARRADALSSVRFKAPSRSGYEASASSSSKALPGLFPGADFPCVGEQKGLVILVNYSDVKMSTPDAYDYFSRMLNEPGFADRGATGSARDYFMTCSDGRFVPEFDVYGPVELPRERAYYGGNNPFNGSDRYAHEMVIDACDLLDGEVDFSEYDRNGDGYIDNVFVFYAGKGEATGGGDDTVWPHAWEIEAGGQGTHVYDGVVLNRYACSNELVGSRPDGVGTFIHEFSHVMGLPDLYTTNGGNAFTPGSWSVLDYGPYNNNGRTPPLFGAFERCALGWMTPYEISGPLSAELEPISSNTAGIVRTSSENEFFLFENRQQAGWDTYIPGHGMLVWHIHYVPSMWSNNAVNNTVSHQYVDLEEADGIRSEATRKGDAFPGSAGITEFTDETTPSMRTWSGETLNLPVTNIAESPEGMISFDVAGGAEYSFPSTEAYDAAEVTHNSFKASWKDIAGSRYMVTLVDPATMLPLKGFNKVRVGSVTDYEFTGLQPDTEYIYYVSVGNDWQYGSPSNFITVKTKPMTIDLRTVKALPATEIEETSFLASWEAVPEASDHLLSVYSHSTPDTDIAECDFTDRVMPEGWSTSFTAEYSPLSNPSFSGDATPALTLKKNGDALTTPVFSKPVALVKFWHVATKVDPANNITVSVLVGEDWVKVAEFELTKKAGGSRETVDAIPAGAKAVRFEFVKGSGYGNLYIDDIHIECHEPVEKMFVEGFNLKSLGTETSCKVSGLTPGTTYYYTVDATDGSLSAATSKEVKVTLPQGSGIIGVTASPVSVRPVAGAVEVSGLMRGEAVTVVDLLGRTVAMAESDGDTILIPVAPGLYIVKTPATTVKVMVQ